jgi:hypothetical protein
MAETPKGRRRSLGRLRWRDRTGCRRRERAEASARPACLPNTDLCREASDFRRRRLVLAERLWGLEVARLRPAVEPTDNADGKRGKTGAVTV